MVTDTGRGAAETATFTRALASLKRRGSNLLVVGAGNDRTHADACRRLLGDDETDRRRLFVFTDRSGCSVDDETTSGTGTRVVEYATRTRGAAAAQPSETAGSAAGPQAPGRREVVDDLPSLGRAVGEAVADFEDDTAGMAPAQLRLCVDSLRPLLDEHDEQAVFRFLHAMTGDVRAVRGMGHYHLPVAYDDATVRTLAPLFDAVVEIRSQGADAQQRWHLREAGVTTDWLGL